MRLFFLAIVIASLAGCGPDKIVRVGEETDQPGVIRRDIDKSKDIAGEASSRISDGEKEAYGG